MISLFLKQKNAFGLDISETTVRMMHLEPLGKGFFPSAFAEINVPKGYIVDDQVKEKAKLAKLIEQNRQHPTFGKIDTNYAVVSVPEAKSFVRVISVPKMSEQEAQEAVPFEAEQYIPVSSDQVYLDFKILPGPASERDPDKMKVVIAATPKAVIDNYLETVKLANLKPIALEVESEAIARCLVSKQNQNEPVLILDVDTYHTSLIIFDQGTLQFTSAVPIAGNAFTSQIAQSLTISPDEAEKVKRQVGLYTQKDGGRVRESLVPLMNSLTEVINNTLNFYKDHSEGSRQIGQVMVCGGGSKLKGFADYLNNELSSHSPNKNPRFVQMGDPWVNVLEKPIKKVPPISKLDSVSFATVIGLALRGVQAE